MSTFKGFKYITPITIENVEQVSRSETANLRIQTVSSLAQRWELSITMEPINNKDSASLAVKLAAHQFTKGLSTSFDITMPQMLGTGVTKSGNLGVVVDGSRLLITSSSSFTIPQGAFIKFSTHNKVYMVREGVGSVTPRVLTVFPPLVVAMSTLHNTILETDPMIHVIYKESAKQSITYTDGIMTNTTIDVVEYLV